MIRWLLILLLLGCSHFPLGAEYTPIFKVWDVHPISFGVHQSGNGPNDANMNLFLEIFLKKWNEHPSFPQGNPDILDALSSLEVHWQYDIFKNDYFLDSPRLEGLTHRSIQPGKILVFVALSANGLTLPLEQNALGHELIHVFLGATTGDGHPDHLGSQVPSEWPNEYESFLSEVASQYLLDIGC